MLYSQLARVLPVAALVALLPATPAFAGRTVIDSGLNIPLSGYCSPNSESTGGCIAYSMPTIQLGATPYNSFYVNSNGTVSFGSIQSFLTPQNSDTPPDPQTSLADYRPIPIFSPNFVDGQGFLPTNPSEGFDGAFVAQTADSPGGFTVNFFSCGDPLNCGQVTINLLTNATFEQDEVGQFGLVDTIIHAPTFDPNATDEANFIAGRLFLLNDATSRLPIYTLTLAGLADGFQVSYSYNAAATGQTGVYGFDLPGAQLQTTGPLENRTFVFNSVGALVTGVPEPSTWMSLILGFGLAGFALRRQRRQQALA